MSSHEREDRMIVSDAKYIARRELAATHRAMRRELRRVASRRTEAERLAEADETREDSVPTLASRSVSWMCLAVTLIAGWY